MNSDVNRWVVIVYEENDHAVRVWPLRVFCGPGAEAAARAVCTAKESERDLLIKRWADLFQECGDIYEPVFRQRCMDEGIPVNGVSYEHYEAHQLPANEWVGL